MAKPRKGFPRNVAQSYELTDESKQKLAQLVGENAFAKLTLEARKAEYELAKERYAAAQTRVQMVRMAYNQTAIGALEDLGLSADEYDVVSGPDGVQVVAKEQPVT